MNKRNLFRGKSKETKEWIIGHLAAFDLIAPSYPDDTSNATGQWYGKTPYAGFVEVIPETVSQMIIDNDNLTMFEKDIVKRVENGHMLETYIITWDVNECNYIALGQGGCSITLSQICKDSNLEVCGNIHDNPELVVSIFTGEWGV